MYPVPFRNNGQIEYNNLDFVLQIHHQKKKYLYNFDPLKPHFYTVKLGFTGVYIIFLIFA